MLANVPKSDAAPAMKNAITQPSATLAPLRQAREVRIAFSMTALGGAYDRRAALRTIGERLG